MSGLHLAVLEAGCAAGLPLSLGTRVPWLTGRGHLNQFVQERAPAHVLVALSETHHRLGGDASVLATKGPGNPPTPDLIHGELGCLIEVDERQHFTTARLLTFDLYPSEVHLGFDVDEYRALARKWRSKADRDYAHKTSRDFPEHGGRQSQRAYNDALRDLLAPTFTSRPVIRLPVPDRSLQGVVDRLEEAVRRVE